MIDFTPLIQQCAPQVALATMQAVIRTESGFNPLAINVNGGNRLARQPNSPAEAISWAQWLIERGYSVDVGLMQINSANLRRLGLNAADAFEPCNNLKLGAAILTDNYRRTVKQGSRGDMALLRALSAYNTGDFERGMRNGYVHAVMRASRQTTSPANAIAPPLLGKRSASRTKPAHAVATPTPTTTTAAVSPHTAGSEIAGFNSISAF
ncbi:lytic transglycosylase domain-containing protein [Chitinimonas arctica]|uniref:Lytic transglycosylase domain-containing protein n=1 Tax=Chitinimonas arctica TaxID=2594795 RepID=A0A516SHG7_9NEIS|nr:lytic transglycosylase domain-containing protein [Chitinimonas arctica]QDQ27575.1 lytic transglycosylase domain-containing protein [Chitinimonas arctica]